MSEVTGRYRGCKGRISYRISGALMTFEDWQIKCTSFKVSESPQQGDTSAAIFR